MNWKRIVCWWRRSHVPIRFVRADGTHERRCVRCGGVLWRR